MLTGVQRVSAVDLETLRKMSAEEGGDWGLAEPRTNCPLVKFLNSVTAVAILKSGKVPRGYSV